jgi:CubicO group peptidase (beta-lactamase class C family)
VVQTTFCIASIGKLSTAVAIGQLPERYLLAFNALVGRSVRGLPAAIADHVTFADLLTVTSGLDNTRRPAADARRHGALISREPLQFRPGARFL